VYKNIDVKS